MEGKPSSQKMTSEDACLIHVQGIVAGETPNLQDLSFRDPDSSQPGQLRTRIGLWEDILDGYEPAKDVREWLGHGMDIQKFMQPFKYESAEPPTRVFKNHYSCKQFSQFVTETILKRIETGAIRVWGKVGVGAPPYLVLPMTIEPQKSRLCIDARFLNLWMVDTPFSRSERHVAISFTSDASSFRWGAVTHLPTGTVSVGDYWEETVRSEHINVKETWAVLRGLQSLPESVSDWCTGGQHGCFPRLVGPWATL